MTNDSLSSTIYRRITDDLRVAIVSGKFESGQRLKMSELVDRFGTSQMPIREALQQLQGEGLIRIVPQKGAQVRSIDEQFFSNIYDLRVAIESYLIKTVCKQKSLKWVDDLKEAQEIYDSLIEAGDISKLIDANHQFHRIHNTVANNREALETLERWNTLITVMITSYGYRKERILQVSAEHHQMIDCFEKLDVDGVLAVHTQHCETAKAIMLKNVSETIQNKNI